ncbi:hypothetical protein [Actinophytocola sp. KF-1]
MATFRHSVLVLSAAVLVLTGACGESPPSLDTTQTQPPAGGTTSAPPTAGGEPVRLTGTVDAGAEANCLVLDTGDAQYVLLGGDRDQLAPRRRVVVTGVLEPDTATSCMAGIPLRVDEVAPAR